MLYSTKCKFKKIDFPPFSTKCKVLYVQRNFINRLCFLWCIFFHQILQIIRRLDDLPITVQVLQVIFIISSSLFLVHVCTCIAILCSLFEGTCTSCNMLCLNILYKLLIPEIIQYLQLFTGCLEFSRDKYLDLCN